MFWKKPDVVGKKPSFILLFVYVLEHMDIFFFYDCLRSGWCF